MFKLCEKIDVLIYYEHVARELDSCLILKFELEKLGLISRIVPVHKNRYVSLVRYRPRFVVVPFLFANKNDIVYQELKYCYGDVICLNLHHEQFYNEMTKFHFMPNNELSRNVFHLAWGKFFADDLISVGNVDPEKVLICGNPRTDNFYYYSANKIKQYILGYKDIVFVPTSFSWAFVNEEYFIKGAKIERKIFEQKKKLTFDSAVLFLTSIRNLAKKYPQKLFVVRPHPFEDILFYKQFLKGLLNRSLENNILVIREGSVYDWLKVSRLTIGWLTSVSLEASAFGRKNLIYNPIPLDLSTQTDFMKLYDKIIVEYDDLCEIVGNPDSYNIDNKRVVEYLQNSMGKTDGKVNNRIALSISDILKYEKLNQSYNMVGIARNLLKSMLIDIPKNILLKINLLDKIRPLYKGVLEDMLSYKSIDRKYNIFLKEKLI